MLEVRIKAKNTLYYYNLNIDLTLERVTKKPQETLVQKDHVLSMFR